MERDDEMFWSECDDCRAPIFVQRAEGPLRYRLTCDCRAARRYVAGDLATVVLAALGVLALVSLILTFCS